MASVISATVSLVATTGGFSVSGSGTMAPLGGNKTFMAVQTVTGLANLNLGGAVSSPLVFLKNSSLINVVNLLPSSAVVDEDAFAIIGPGECALMRFIDIPKVSASGPADLYVVVTETGINL